MGIKRFSKKRLLEEIEQYNNHIDELVTTDVKNWGSYSEDTDKADCDFLVQRDDVFAVSQIEFEEDELDRALVKQRANYQDVDIDDLDKE